jgi:hypothetical protein
MKPSIITLNTQQKELLGSIRPLKNNYLRIKQLIQQLFFDRELVESIKVSNKEYLYIQLMSGKITMKEYIAAARR